MQLRKVIYFLIISLTAASTGYLLYLCFSVHVDAFYRLRMYTFAVQHLFCLSMLIYRFLFWTHEQPIDSLKWMTAFTTINFLIFAGVELYGVLSHETQNIGFEQFDTSDHEFAVISYYHFYYQFNIYLGIFSLFCVILACIFYIKERNHRENVNEILVNMEQYTVNATGEEQPCSICLTEFQKDEKIYKLLCTHTFHIECLRDWFKEKLTCPMCRDDATRYRT